MALRLRVDDTDMKAPVSLVASTRSRAVTRSMPLMARRWCSTRAA